MVKKKTKEHGQILVDSDTTCLYIMGDCCSLMHGLPYQTVIISFGKN